MAHEREGQAWKWEEPRVPSCWVWALSTPALGQLLPRLTCRDPAHRSDFRRRDSLCPASQPNTVCALAPYLRILPQCFI